MTTHTAFTPVGAGRDVADATRRIRWGQWVARVIVAIIAVWLARFLVTNDRFEWDVVWAWFQAPAILKALWTTLWLAAIAMAVGLFFGILVALARMSRNRLVSGLAGLYVWFFRGTPLLVQLIFWFNLAYLMPRISIGIPFGGPKLASWDTNHLITSVTAAILGLGLNEVAYMAEIIRGGLLSVDPGQREAAKAFGMNSARAMRRVVLPQAMRAIIPPTGNQLINMVKATAMVSVIAMADLLYTVQAVYNQTFQTIPLLIVAVLWYLIVTSVLNVIQSFIEYHYSRGSGTHDTSLAAFLTNMVRARRSPDRALLSTQQSAGDRA